MKTILLTLLSLSFIVISCSDNLNTSKAEKLINECDEKFPKYETSYIDTGNNLALYEEMVKIYNQLEKEGLLKIEKKENTKLGLVTYNIELTEKGKEYTDTNKSDRLGVTRNSVKVITYKLKLKSVNSIHEIPSMNAAEIATTYEREATPFSILKPDSEKEKENKVTLLKTNKGWKACDTK